MKKISRWARKNPAIAITCIVLIKLFLATIAVYIGISLFNSGTILSTAWLLFAILLLALSIAFYPPRQTNRPGRYILQKTCDFALGLVSFISILYFSNSSFQAVSLSTKSYASITPAKTDPRAADILKAIENHEKQSLTRKEKRILKREFFSQLKIYAKAKALGNKEESDHALAILLSIIAALGLLYVLAAVVCGLSCNGSDAAAIVVGISGLAAIIIGLVFLIKRINRGPSKKEKKE